MHSKYKSSKLKHKGSKLKKTVFKMTRDKTWVTRVLVDLQNHYRTMKNAKITRSLS